MKHAVYQICQRQEKIIKSKYGVFDRSHTNGEFITLSLDSEVKFIREFHFSKKGFYLSDYEIKNFRKNIVIWNDIVEHDLDCALIIMEHVIPNSPISDIVNYIYNIKEEWDLYFSYDGAKKDKSSASPTWVMAAYSISKNGAKYLSEITEILLPIDEQIFNFYSHLNIFFEEKGFFSKLKDDSLYLARITSLKQSLQDNDSWNHKNKSTVRILLAHLSIAARSLNIDLVLLYGTLLGYVRHGEIMPWDDDIDLGIDSKDINKLLTFFLCNEEISYKKYIYPRENLIYYKFWHKESVKIEGFEHKFPFIDIWLFDNKSDKIIFYSTLQIPHQFFFPYQKVKFENSEFKIPADPLHFLNTKYPQWQSNIIVFPWSHRLEKASFHQIVLPIVVNEHGRLIE